MPQYKGVKYQPLSESLLARPLQVTKMFGKQRFFGLRGLKLNIAVGVVAGLDFTLFGYDQGVVGALLGLESWYNTFPEIDTSSPRYMSLSPNERYHNSIIQGSHVTVPYPGVILQPC